ncbi:MAG: TIGR01906 family membrane protein [Anaerolineales bacterium]|nr:TIGR01906 family membrane protein [Anaerolineales bacterium]MCW5856166.1 TIGR01906 family membrane protein [Anaerolineales bacterium]
MRKLFLGLVSLIVPVFLLLTGLRLLLTPAFVELEYSLPGFPADSYGMPAADRQRYALSALDYLVNEEGIEFLGDQTFPDGAPLYNQRELRHMHDVKQLTQAVLNVWVGITLASVALFLLARRGGWSAELRSAIQQGGRLTVLLIAAILILVVLSFDAIFVGFHRIFFEGDTWLFQYTDTLIRLFPMRFWQDVFIAAGLLTALGGLLLGWVWPRLKARG